MSSEEKFPAVELTAWLSQPSRTITSYRTQGTKLPIADESPGSLAPREGDSFTEDNEGNEGVIGFCPRSVAQTVDPLVSFVTVRLSSGPSLL